MPKKATKPRKRATKPKSTYKSGFCISGAHKTCTVDYGNEAHPVACTCRCHRRRKK